MGRLSAASSTPRTGGSSSPGQSYFDLFTTPSPFRHLWSLAIEEQFYLVWPLVVLGCLRIARGKLRVLVGVCVVGVIGSVS